MTERTVSPREGDAEAIELTLGGDRDAYRVLVERHSASVFRLAFRLTGNRQPLAVNIGMIIEVVESPAHGKVKQTHPVYSHKVKMASEVVVVFRLIQLAAVQPFQVQSEHASLGEIDAQLLFSLA